MLRMRWTGHFFGREGILCLQDAEGAEKEMEAEEAGQCERRLQFVACGSASKLHCRRLHPKRLKMHRRRRRSRWRWMGFA